MMVWVTSVSSVSGMCASSSAIRGGRLTRAAERRFNAWVDVANPIYDVVFTYLMQNQRVARLLIGRITGLAVQSLTVSPQGTALRRTPEDPEHDLPLTLLRMTFAARVQTHDGSEQVLIEILKANAQTVIKRYRRYLSQQVGRGETILTHPSGRTEAVPIVTIYFLGYALDGLSDEAVIVTSSSPLIPAAATLRLAYAPTNRRDQIVVSPFWNEQQLQTDGSWTDHPVHRYGRYDATRRTSASSVSLSSRNTTVRRRIAGDGPPAPAATPRPSPRGPAGRAASPVRGTAARAPSAAVPGRAGCL